MKNINPTPGTLFSKEPNGSRTAYTSPQVKEILDACRIELDRNFDLSGFQILAIYGAKLGLTAPELRDLLADDKADQDSRHDDLGASMSALEWEAFDEAVNERAK